MIKMKMQIMEGDVFEQLPKIPSESIDLCITSPPFWGLRDYGVEGQLGNEPTMEAFLDNTIRWVKEVWRVLKPTGSFVLNIGDCFVRPTGSEKDNEQTKRENPAGAADGKYQKHNEDFPRNRLGGIYKTKQLLSVSSFAYCRIVSETDLVCRGEHIWCKPAVPSPIRCRLKHSHEKLFWFVKDADKYYFKPEAWMKKTKTRKARFNTNPISENVGLSKTSCYRAGNPVQNEETIEHSWRIVQSGQKQSGFEMEGEKPESEHIAPFPELLIEPYVISLCPKDGTVLDPFLGSGTSMRVAMENGRNSIGIELNPNYIRYAKSRCNWGSGLNVEYCEGI